MNSSWDAIVIGLGAMGSAAAYHLAKRGAKVLGLEQFSLGHDRGSSHGETRIIRKAYFEHPDYIPLLNRAYENWTEIETVSREKLFHEVGMLIFGDPQKSTVYRGVLEGARRFHIPIEEFSEERVAQRWPQFKAPSSLGAVFEPGAGFLACETAVQALARAAKSSGALLQLGESVRDLKSEGKGMRVITDRGSYLADKVVVTAGAWSGRILEDLNLPLKIKRKFLCWFPVDSPKLWNCSPCFAFHYEDRFYYGFPCLDGKTIKLAEHFDGEWIEDLDEKREISEKEARLLTQFVESQLCYVRGTLERSARCLYTVTPDEDFIIDLHPQNSNLIFACGFSGHGFKFASVVGEILSDLAQKQRTTLPSEFLRLRSF